MFLNFIMQASSNYMPEFEMDNTLTLDFFNQFWKDNLVIIYCGYFNDKSLISLTDIIALHYDIEESKNKFKGRFVYLTVETFQNVIRYTKPLMDKMNLNGHKNFFFTKKVDDDFFISTANVVKPKSIDIIEKKIKEVNNLSQEELNTKYKEVLLNKAFSEEGGAGLGFIEMGRKTKQNLDYSFEK
ncbi:MAG: SiaB family protein kinase, partial [Bacteroidota bacterium]|nr:SiaB family protein kinase [Bacteroidota bacterium]